MSYDAEPLTQKQLRGVRWSLGVAVLVVVVSLVFYRQTGNGAALAFTGAFAVSAVISA